MRHRLNQNNFEKPGSTWPKAARAAAAAGLATALAACVNQPIKEPYLAADGTVTTIESNEQLYRDPEAKHECGKANALIDDVRVLKIQAISQLGGVAYTGEVYRPSTVLDSNECSDLKTVWVRLPSEPAPRGPVVGV